MARFAKLSLKLVWVRLKKFRLYMSWRFVLPCDNCELTRWRKISKEEWPLKRINLPKVEYRGLGDPRCATLFQLRSCGHPLSHVLVSLLPIHMQSPHSSIYSISHPIHKKFRVPVSYSRSKKRSWEQKPERIPGRRGHHLFFVDATRYSTVFQAPGCIESKGSTLLLLFGIRVSGFYKAADCFGSIW